MEKRIHIIEKDITALEVDAIVNAANNALRGGGGVDGAIHRAAGPELLAECRQHPGCPTGEVVLTRGYRLPSKNVIHTVGPIWRGGDFGEAQLLARCYQKSLALAQAQGFRSIAFPAISCGVYRFPILQAAEIAIRTIQTFIKTHEMPAAVFLVCFGLEVKQAYESVLENP